MPPVDVTIELDASPETVFAFLLDIARTPEWVTICKAVTHLDDGPVEEGWRCEQRYVLRGAPFTVRWTLDKLAPSSHISWKGRGPARSSASIQQDLTPRRGGGTVLRYRNEFAAPGGVLGAVASRALVGDTAETEAMRSLDRLAELLGEG